MKKLLALIIAIISILSVVCLSACNMGKGSYQEAPLIGNTYVLKDVEIKYYFSPSCSTDEQEEYLIAYAETAFETAPSAVRAKAIQDNKDKEIYFGCNPKYSYFTINGGEETKVGHGLNEKVNIDGKAKWIMASIYDCYLIYDETGETFTYTEDIYDTVEETKSEVDISFALRYTYEIKK